MTSVAGVIVTFNRKVLLVECLRAMLAQTRPLERILVVDNASTDGTEELLLTQGFLNQPTIRYLRLEHNSGGAGGFHAGMKAAYEEGHDWLWLMDDDAEPAIDALAKLEEHFGRSNISALAPMVTDAQWRDEHVEQHRGMRIDDAMTGVIRPLSADEMAGRDLVELTHCSFVGPCFPRRTIDQVGLPIADFFIHYDDYEYAQRARKVGRILLVTAAKIAHKEAQAVGRTDTRQFLGLRSARPTYNALWLSYFGYRNLIWLSKREGSAMAKARLFARHARRLLETAAFDDHKWRRIRFWNAAFSDGLAGRFDNDRPRKLLY